MKFGKYKHYKGKCYEVIAVAVHTETREELVVYKQLYSSPGFPKNSVWVRPQKMFLEKVEIDGKRVQRFEYIENDGKI
ncbi:MAG TPA: DUF1653 domain-containing protein [Candidatus Saccharimonadales bacterium]|nr:DUF1653 domain-containing protein [Candidatus Saccharimonadales bacterium]